MAHDRIWAQDTAVAGTLTAREERWPIGGKFTISRGVKTQARVVVAKIEADGLTGRGECVPYPRYNETPAGVISQILAFAPLLRAGLTRATLHERIAPGAARNALDCALWDLAARQTGKPVWQLAGLSEIQPLTTAFTLSLDEPAKMARAARHSAGHAVLKLKLGRKGDEARLRAIRAAVPDARLIVDANEGWSPQTVEPLLALCADLGVELVEQPLPADNDDCLASIERRVAVCADESIHGLDSLDPIKERYDAINIKLDKTGGLSEALMLAEAATARGMAYMAGCMVSTSLAMAPAMLVAQGAMLADLDGPLLLENDRPGGITYDGGVMRAPAPGFWGA